MEYMDGGALTDILDQFDFIQLDERQVCSPSLSLLFSSLLFIYMFFFVIIIFLIL